MNRKNVLVLDPERDVCELFARALESRRDCKCYLASKEEEAVNLLKDIPFDLVLIDLDMALDNDFKLLKKIRRLFPGVAVVVDAYLHQKTLIVRAIAAGANGHIIKPIKVDSFRKSISEFFAPVVEQT